jgi:cell division protein FtsL
MKLRYALLIGGVAVASMMGVHELKSQVRQDRAAVERLLAERNAVRADISGLRNEIAVLERPERLRTLAAQHLGLVPADPSRIVNVDDASLVLAQIRHAHRGRNIVLTGGGQ